jgi:hypothetical protein|tara:strand:+ start:570 stop:797 length:228 start_codon:yes stop_codon:yes gene_type:complete
MKELNSFLTEKNKDRPLRKDEGKDDQKYIDLMGYYKHVARKTMDREEANKHLAKAKKLAKEGDVSKKARTAGAYI